MDTHKSLNCDEKTMKECKRSDRSIKCGKMLFDYLCHATQKSLLYSEPGSGSSDKKQKER